MDKPSKVREFTIYAKDGEMKIEEDGKVLSVSREAAGQVFGQEIADEMIAASLENSDGKTD